MSDGIVILGFGPQPMDFFKKAQKACGKDAVVSPDVARMAGANLAAGTPEALATLRARLQAGSIAAAREAQQDRALPAGAVEWLGAGERGISSETIFSTLTGMNVLKRDRGSHPHDPDDFRRCELLLEAVPTLRADLHKMRAVSSVWHSLVDNWNAIRQTFDEEAPGWRDRRTDWSAPRTYALMRRVIVGNA